MALGAFWPSAYSKQCSPHLPAQPRLAVADAGVCAAALLGLTFGHVICGFKLFIYFSSHLCCPLRFQGSPQTQQWECFLVFGNFSLFKDSLPRTDLCPYLIYISLYLVHFFLPPFEDNGCFSECLMSSVCIQKLFCGIYSAFKCSLMNLWGRKWSPHPIPQPS